MILAHTDQESHLTDGEPIVQKVKDGGLKTNCRNAHRDSDRHVAWYRLSAQMYMHAQVDFACPYIPLNGITYTELL